MFQNRKCTLKQKDKGGGAAQFVYRKYITRRCHAHVFNHFDIVLLYIQMGNFKLYQYTEYIQQKPSIAVPLEKQILTYHSHILNALADV